LISRIGISPDGTDHEMAFKAEDRHTL